jgi:uncharacterized membrane protein
MYYGPVHDGWYWGLHILFSILLFAALIAFIVWVATTLRHSHTTAAPAAPQAPAARSVEVALHEARMRYARGEMTREQFLQISNDLAGGGSPVAPPQGS